jgi:hypothetical protein
MSAIHVDYKALHPLVSKIDLSGAKPGKRSEMVNRQAY